MLTELVSYQVFLYYSFKVHVLQQLVFYNNYSFNKMWKILEKNSQLWKEKSVN